MIVSKVEDYDRRGWVVIVVDTCYPAPAQVHVKKHAPTSPLFLCVY